MKPMRQLNISRSFVLGALCLGLMAAAPTQAKAASCVPLLNSLVSHLEKPSSVLSFKHTTNYQRPNYWDTAGSYGFLELTVGGPILSGTASRGWDGGNIEDLLVEFYANGRVRFAGQYGPYPTQCYSNKFLTVNSHDSFETFTFAPYYR